MRLTSRMGALVTGFVVWAGILFSAMAGEESATVITRENIRQMNVGSIQDVLNQVPGISATDSYISIRGSYKVKVFLDGNSINDPTSTSGAIKWGTVSLNQVDRIEILRGGGASSFGSNASGGVVLIQTRPPEQGQKNTQAMVEAWAGNLSTVHGYASLDQMVDRGPGVFGIRAAAGVDISDGYLVNNDKDKRHVEVKLSYRPRADSCVKMADIIISRLEEEKGYPGTIDYPTPNARHWYDLTTVVSNAAFKGFKNKFTYRQADKEDKNPDYNLETFLNVTNTIDELTHEPVSLGPGQLSAGLGLQRDEAEASSFSDQSEDQYWFFATYAGQIKTLNYTLGTRASNHTEFGTSISPEIKLAWSQGSWSWISRAGLAHNTPSFYQRYNESSSTAPNPDLDKEIARNLSTEISYTFNARLSATLSPYYNRIEDRITYIRDNTAKGQYQNIGKVTYAGVDLSFRTDLLDNLTLNGAWSYLEAKNEETGKYLTGASRHRIKSDLNYKPLSDLTLRLTGKYTGSAYCVSDNSESVGGFTVWDFRAEYRVKSVLWFVDIKNIFDNRYMYSEKIWGSPRTFYAGLRWQL